MKRKERFVKERKADSQRTTSNGVEEPLEKYAVALFGSRKDVFTYKDHCKYVYNGQKGEIDLIAWTKKHLYLIECKNSILPAGYSELRTTFDYIMKAQTQLDLSKAALSDDKVKKELFNSWGVPIEEYHIHTLILLGNRMFSAPNGFRHPIRYIHELYMLLTSGEINSSFGKWRYWKDHDFSEDDFLKYISNEDPLSNDLIDAMDSYKMSISYKNHRLEKQTYSLNIMKYYELNDKRLTNLSSKRDYQQRDDFMRAHDETLKKYMRAQ